MEKTVTRTVIETVTVDDFNGREMGGIGWALVRRQDGATVHFGGLSDLVQNEKFRSVIDAIEADAKRRGLYEEDDE